MDSDKSVNICSLSDGPKTAMGHASQNLTVAHGAFVRIFNYCELKYKGLTKSNFLKAYLRACDSLIHATILQHFI